MMRTIAVITLVTTPLLAQGGRSLVGELEQRGTCANCRLVARHLTTYGSASDAELIPDAGVFIRLPDGRLLVGQQRGGLILHYAASGRYLGTLGRLGDGPGEYRNARMFLNGPGDSVTILGSNIITVISTRSGMGRSEPIGLTVMPDAITRLPDGRLVFNTHYPRSPAFVMLGRDLKRERAFGPVMASGPDRDGNYDEPIHRLATSRRGGFWAAKIQYVRRIERWLPNGTVVQRLDSVVPWFPRYVSSDVTHNDGFSRQFTHRPYSGTLGIREAADGRLWVLGYAADRQWAPVANVPPLRSYEDYLAYKPPADPNRHVDGIIDVIDTESGRSIGTWRFHEFFSAFFEDGVVMRVREDDDGVRVLEVWRLELQGR